MSLQGIEAQVALSVAGDFRLSGDKEILENLPVQPCDAKKRHSGCWQLLGKRVQVELVNTMKGIKASRP